MNNKIKNSWNKEASGGIQGWYAPDNPNRFMLVEQIIKNPERAFPTAVYPLIKKHIGTLRDKKVCVPSSGDNIAAFGFFLLGAKVTSCDISENMIKNAKAIADRYNLDIEFVCQDSMKLENIKSGEYDLVYTSNGVHVWIDDLCAMYKNFNRILKDGGYNIFFETHPMIRPFDDSRVDIVKIIKLYEDIELVANDGVPRYQWRMQDIVNAIIESGFCIKRMDEFHSVPEDLTGNYLDGVETNPEHPNYGKNMYDWNENPWAALPQCLCLCSQKV